MGEGTRLSPLSPQATALHQHRSPRRDPLMPPPSPSYGLLLAHTPCKGPHCARFGFEAARQVRIEPLRATRGELEGLGVNLQRYRKPHVLHGHRLPDLVLEPL